MLRVEGEFRQQEGSIPPTLVNNLQQDIDEFSFFTKLSIESMIVGLKDLSNMFANSRTVADEMT